MEDCVQLDGSVLLDEVTCVIDELDSASRDQMVELSSLIDGYPPVCSSPDDQRRHTDLGVERFDLVGVALIGLGDLPVERGLSFRTQPRGDQRVMHEGR